MQHTFYTTELKRIYKTELAASVEQRLRNLVHSYRGRIQVPAASSLTERDSILITYADQVRKEGQAPLQTLADFCEAHLRATISGIHILPFFPWSSDDGFSVKDYRTVDSSLGSWGDLERLGRSFHLMFDGVINHASAQGEWFQAFLRDEAPYRNYFLTVKGDFDLTKVVRPRTLPLLTEFQTASGPRQVWTTFSPDQVDLDYHNPDVLLDIFDVLLMYAERGARFIRLDAIAYLWKETSTTCIHLPQVHAIIRLLRAVLDEAAPHVHIITETNVPHEDNISYFGDGKNEAQLIYNFALPPLILHTFRTGDASILSEWAADLELPSDRTTFFNFLASHDGIGLNPARGIISPNEIVGLVAQTHDHGGLISYKQNADGTQSPYELNINYFDALSNPTDDEPLGLQVNRFMAAQAIMLSLRGVPGIYFHSLFGSRNWIEGVNLTKHNRTINRQKLECAELESKLVDPTSLRSQVFVRYRQLLLLRAATSTFNPHSNQEILDMGRSIFSVLRTSPGGDRRTLCIHNVTDQTQFAATYTLRPYQTFWVDLP